MQSSNAKISVWVLAASRPATHIASAFPGGLLGDSRCSLASRELGAHVGGSDPMVRKQDEAVEPQVRDLGDQPQSITVLRRHDRLRRFLADLLEDGVVALREELSDVRR